MAQTPSDPPAAASRPTLDHVVIDVRDRMDEAVHVYRQLGFALTPRGKHSLGSINHLAIFEDSYLELLGFDKGVTETRTDIMKFPIGLNGLVFRSDDSAATWREMTRNGVPVEEPLEFSRPVDLGGGKRQDARFRVVRLRPGTISGGRLYFCHHFTRHLVWRDEWQHHPNGALGIAGVTMVAPEPGRVAGLFRKMFGDASVQEGTGGVTLKMANSRVKVVRPDEALRRFGAAMAEPAGREEYLAALTIRSAKLAETAQALRGIPGLQVHPSRMVVDAAGAFNVALEFV